MIPIASSEKIKKFPYVNILLILVNLGIFIYVYFYSPNPVKLITGYGFVPVKFSGASWNPLIDGHKYLSLLTANFLHADFFHITGNLLFLFVFGNNVNEKLGNGRYLVFFVVTGIISLLTQGYSMRDSANVVIGASGAIAGVMGGFYILYPRARVKTFLLVSIKEISALFYLFFWFIFNLLRGIMHFEGIAIESVAWWAHIGGFVAGAILVNLFIPHNFPVKSKKG
ncbi:MAG: rhomboid family intramembrane serine protease [Vulcanimicrobiota bacterium]